METLLQDIRFGFRMLCKKPMLTVVVVLTLALGVGANTAIFSIVNAVLLHALPYRNPDRLVRIFFNNPGVGLRDVRFSVPELDDLKTRSGVFEEVTPVGQGSVNLTGAKQPERLEMIISGSNYFSMLGAVPQIGRLFGTQDFALGFALVAVISDGLWRRSYGADPNVIGRSLRLDNDPYTIVGVLPNGFRHPGPPTGREAEVWLATGFRADPWPRPANRATRFIFSGAIGRLKPGLTLEQAQARLSAMAIQLRHDFATDYPPQAQWTIEIQPLRESLVGKVRPMLLVLMGAVILIVLVVSLNIANLLMARASGRQQEMALRLALGAGRGRIVRQMLTESMLLSLLGGLAGVGTAVGSLRFILRFVPPTIPRLGEVRIDWVVLAFALLVSLLTGLGFGLVPAVHSRKSTLNLAIREGSRGSGYSKKTGRLRDALVVSEIAFAVILMVGAGLLLRTLVGLLQESPGFNPARVVTASIWLSAPNDPKLDPYLGLARQIPFKRELLRRMGAIPGVDLAAITSVLPATGRSNSAALAVEDRPVESAQDLRAEIIQVSPDYFRVIQTPLVRGRFFTEGDEDGKQPVAIIDEATARRYWSDRDPIGRRLRFGQDPGLPWMTIVGIVKDIKQDGLDVNGVPHIYLSVYQSPGRVTGAQGKGFSIVLRSLLPAPLLEPQIRLGIAAIDSGLPVFNVFSMDDVFGRSVASRRFSADLVGGFAGLALLLAAIGIYGLLAYLVGQRSREIGIRMALGAPRGAILRLFLGKGAALAGVGILAGLVFSASTAPMMASLLYGVRPHDPAVFLAVPLMLAAVVALASIIPARRAAKLNPITALREG